MIRAGVRESFDKWLRSPQPPCVFVVGTGRSGTHLLAELLSASPNLRVLVEKQPLFRWSAAMAADHRLESTLFPRWVRRFRLEQFAVAPKVVVDKCHTNMWLVERLAEAFPRALFLATRRSPHATVASMLKHGGFAFPPGRLRELPLPNRFLGIVEESAGAYLGLSPPEQFALRWISNERRRAVVRQVLGERLFEVEYERLVLDTQRTVLGIGRFLSLEQPLPTPAIKANTLGKWRQDLTSEQITAVDAMLCRHGFADDVVASAGRIAPVGRG